MLVIALQPRDLLFFGIFIIANLFLLRILAEPSIGPVRYQYAGFDWQTAEHPLFVPSESKELTVELPLQLSWLHPNVFYVKPDDCMQQLVINDVVFKGESENFCDYSTLGQPLDMSAYLKAGENLLRFTLVDNGGKGGLRITPSRTDGILLTLNLLLILSSAGLALLACALFAKSKLQRQLLSIFVGGSALRLLYMLSTHYFVRGHDTDDHIKYIRFVAENFAMPPASEGFVFHHPPLYYFIGALVMRFDFLLGRSHDEVILHDLQVLSLILSIATLGIAVWIAQKLFARQGAYAVLFLSVVATLPSLIFLAARITNGTLDILLGFLCFGLLVQWWQSRRPRDWYLLVICIAFASLTRINNLAFLPIAFLLFPLISRISWRKRVGHFMAGSLLFVLLTIWFPIHRFVTETDKSNMFSLGNNAMHSGLRLETTIENVFTFNPIAFLRVPFNHPWEDMARRQFFPEYFFRSAFFGEFQFPDIFVGLAEVLLFVASCALIFLVIGFWKAGILRIRESLPITLLFVLLFGAQMAYRVFAPYSANQDFRHSLLLLLPISYFILTGIQESPKSFAAFGRYLVVTMASLCAAFIVLLHFYES
jgi:hypothetical protein